MVLVACRTDVTAADHDEALTLSTAFLAAGAVTAVGSRWDLRDDPSAALMFMFHHYLAAGRRPDDALRDAQLWMLDPDRVPPPSMPEALRNPRAARGRDRMGRRHPSGPIVSKARHRPGIARGTRRSP